MNGILVYYKKENLRRDLFGCERIVSSPFLREINFKVNREKRQDWKKMLQMNSDLYLGVSNFQLKE